MINTMIDDDDYDESSMSSGNTDATGLFFIMIIINENSLLVLDSRSYPSLSGLSVCVCVLLMLLFSQGY